MLERHPGFCFGWCAVSAPLLIQLPWAVDDAYARAQLVIPMALLMVSLVVHAVACAIGPSKSRLGRGGFWAVLLLTWAAFWLLDLRHARAQALVVVVPVAASMGALLARALVVRAADPRHPHRPPLRSEVRVGHLAAAFMVPAFSLLWGVFLQRADNGCAGISDAYAAMLLFTAVLIFALGPTTVASHLAECRAVVVPAPQQHSPYRIAERPPEPSG